MTKPYSQLSLAVDLVSYEYQTGNPIIIAEKIYEDLGIDISIHQISDYMDINKLENFKKQSKKIEYYESTLM